MTGAPGSWRSTTGLTTFGGPGAARPPRVATLGGPTVRARGPYAGAGSTVHRYQWGHLARARASELGAGPALYFENDVAFRRVADYPDDWRDLPTGELEILSQGT